MLKKDKTVLLDELFNTPATSLLIFRFEPQSQDEIEAKMRSAVKHHHCIDGKDLYLIDGLFSDSEGDEMREFSATSSFSRNSYGSSEAIAKGQKPARFMNGKERWQFFANPPKAVQELYKFFGLLAQKLDADVTTLPWELCSASSHGSPAVIANKLEESSEESMKLGKHQDCNPEEKISFGIPILYREGEFHDCRFNNGSPGKPWLISAMLYATDKDFLPEYRMGTVFYERDGEIAVRADCTHMRLVLFEGDIFHSMEESKIPDGIKTWRVSYVFKLILNPRRKDVSVKQAFSKWITK